MLRNESRLHPAAAIAILATVVLVAGCSRNTSNPVASGDGAAGRLTSPGVSIDGQYGRTVIRDDGSTPPSNLATVQVGPASLSLWPYTGNSFDGQGVDPVNVVFIGNADPVALRDALLGLDGDRTALGYPNEYPFNQRWKDTTGGDVQTNWTAAGGWSGSEVQLSLGDYGPVRFHLRLFRTRAPFGEGGWWTVGAAHFELLIPNTTSHQVLSWERAEQIVTADMMRSGLLDATTPVIPVAGVGPSPTWRGIPDYVYNELPASLIGFIEGPAPPITGEAPMPNDGVAMVLNVARRADPAGSASESFTVPFRQLVPKPFCSDGPYDYVLVEGPVDFSHVATRDEMGGLYLTGRATGTLAVTPIDVTQNPPAPIGPTWYATIGDLQDGWIQGQDGRVQFQVKRILPQDSGSEMLMTMLKVASQGRNSFTLRERCLSEEMPQ